MCPRDCHVVLVPGVGRHGGPGGASAQGVVAGHVGREQHAWCRLLVVLNWDGTAMVLSDADAANIYAYVLSLPREPEVKDVPLLNQLPK